MAVVSILISLGSVFFTNLPPGVENNIALGLVMVFLIIAAFAIGVLDTLLWVEESKSTKLD